MKVILFNEEEHPTTGALYVVEKVYSIHDGMYGPQTAIVLREVDNDSSYQLLQSNLVPQVGNRPQKA